MANSNFAVLNPLTKGTRSTLSHGNLKHSATTADLSGMNATFGVTTGKWYWELYIYDSGSGYFYTGIGSGYEGGGHYHSGHSNLNGMQGNAIRLRDNGTISDQSSSDDPDRWGTISISTTNVSTMDNGDIVMVALDYDNSKLWFGKNGTFFNSGNPATGTNAQVSWDGDVPIIFPLSENYHNNIQTYNFGQDSSFAGQKSTGSNSAADGNGFGDFYYAPPSGYLALCSGNQTTSTDIDPAETDSEIGSKQCGAVTYTGNGTTQSITGLGFKPDLVWLKERSSATTSNHKMTDSSRGVQKAIESNANGPQGDDTNGVTAFGTDGFSVGSDGNYNENTQTYVAWCWRANGGTTSTNTDGTLASTVQANQAAGFSIVTTTGNGTASTIGHGLGKAPKLIFSKQLNSTGIWVSYHPFQDDGGGSGHAGYLHLSENQAYSSLSSIWNNTAPTSTVFSVGNAGNTNANASTYVHYCWAEIEGYSKFGTYTGNGETGDDGVFIFTGFRPRIAFFKRANGTSGWTVVDSETYPRNTRDGPERIEWDTNAASVTGSSATREMDLLSNGIKIRTSNTNVNIQDGHYIFGAWGDVPFKYNNTR